MRDEGEILEKVKAEVLEVTKKLPPGQGSPHGVKGV